METDNVLKIKEKVQKITETLDKKNERYDDFKWFSAINYTTQAEYCGELKLFLEDIWKNVEVECCRPQIRELIQMINDYFEESGDIT